MYWLRRIPPETRIVVLVVFLALIQAILLSVFGLGAIRGERRQAERQIGLYAENFLRVNWEFMSPRYREEPETLLRGLAAPARSDYLPGAYGSLGRIRAER